MSIQNHDMPVTLNISTQKYTRIKLFKTLLKLRETRQSHLYESAENLSNSHSSVRQFCQFKYHMKRSTLL
jgi:hypothetical protein